MRDVGFWLAKIKERHRQARLSAGGRLPSEQGGWHIVNDPGEPAFQGGWTHEGFPEALVAFRKTERGIAFLIGVAYKGTYAAEGDLIFTLPAGYAPQGKELFDCWGTEAYPNDPAISSAYYSAVPLTIDDLGAVRHRDGSGYDPTTHAAQAPGMLRLMHRWRTMPG